MKIFCITEAESRAATERQRQEEQVNVTRHKVETLRKIMEERKAKREARRLAAAAAAHRAAGPPSAGPPTAASYSTAWSCVSESPAAAAECEEKHKAAAEAAEHGFLQPEPEPVTA